MESDKINGDSKIEVYYGISTKHWGKRTKC